MRPVITALAAVLLLAACSSTDEGNPQDTAPATSAASSPGSSAATSAATSAASTPATAQATTPSATTAGECPAQAQYRVTIVTGTLECAAAYAVAAKFDRQGAAVQQVDGYTCQSGTAATRPVLFTCTSPTAEFTVSEP